MAFLLTFSIAAERALEHCAPEVVSSEGEDLFACVVFACASLRNKAQSLRLRPSSVVFLRLLRDGAVATRVSFLLNNLDAFETGALFALGVCSPGKGA